MDLDEAREFVREHHHAVIATFRKDGRVQLSPILVGIDPEGRLEFSTSEQRVKVLNLRRDPRASVCVMTEGFFGRWIQVDGTADIVALPEALEPLVEYYRRLQGEHPDWEEYRRAMFSERRALVRVTPDRAGPG